MKVRKSGVKNIYCSTCKKWITDCFVGRHVQSKTHFMKNQNHELHPRKPKLKSAMDSGSISSTHVMKNVKDKVSDKQQEATHCTVQGDAVTHYTIQGEKVMTWGSEAFQELPQNVLGLSGLDDTWDFESTLMNDEHATENGITTDNGINGVDVQPRSVQYTTHNGLNPWTEFSTEVLSGACPDGSVASTEFPIDVLSGVFPERVCDDPHHNQISYFKCHLCNPTTYKDYESW
ncbi:hypothetical protein MAR_011757 [Mya arenaria]|uniref:C2H2-type domain-containing protein n=1 Tax=Mya arenaria TaxID=6604 RepID=A0ABY7FV20_MYAAR|nr:hypothetical protein MAR_011757 [Mya arenaria]